jgi:hypothetical protein
MNKILNYINENYKNQLNQYTFIKSKELWKLKIGLDIKYINKNDLKLYYGGKINKIEKNWNFIKVYNVDEKKYKIIYPENMYIFYKK